MKRSRLWLWLDGIFGAAAIWYGLVGLGTRNDPIFWGKIEPKGAAVVVVVGVFALARAVSWWVKLSKKDDSDQDR